MSETALAGSRDPSDESPLLADGRAYGVWAPALTPLDSDLMPDHAKAIRYYRWLLSSGCHGLAFMGTNSEATSFSVAERIELLEATLEAGIAGARLMVGTGCPAFTDSVELTAHATKHGCSVLVLPAYYYKGISDEGLYAYYAEIIERVGDADLKFYFYHFPKLSAVPIPHGVIARLLKAYPGTIKGLKDSSGDAAGTAAFIEAFPELAIFPGTELLMLPMLQKGGAGTITAGANINAAAIRALYDAYSAGDPAMHALNEGVAAVRKCVQNYDMISALKAAMGHGWDDVAWRRVRPPLVPMDEAGTAAFIRDLEAAGYRMAPE